MHHDLIVSYLERALDIVELKLKAIANQIELSANKRPFEMLQPRLYLHDGLWHCDYHSVIHGTGRSSAEAAANFDNDFHTPKTAVATNIPV
jgi:hypothetical protein